MAKQKLKSQPLEPCSTKRAKLKNEGEELRNKELESLVEGSGEAQDELKLEVGVGGLLGIPSPPVAQKGTATFVLERASLNLAYIGKKYQILSSDEHADFLRKKKLNPYDYRPDIVHEALLQIMDSRLCLAGRLSAVYIKTDAGVLIKVEPDTQIPGTLTDFCHMMAELLQTLKIKAKGKGKKLLSVVDNPVTKHLPISSYKIGLSFSSEKAVQLREHLSGLDSSQNLVFVVGAMAHGKIECDFIEDLVSVSEYHLASGICLRRICASLERKWNIL